MKMKLMYSSASQPRSYALLFLNIMLTSGTSQTPVLESGLDLQDSSYFRDMKGAPSSASVLNKEIELGRIIQDMLSQTLSPKRMAPGGSKRWAEISLNQLNARLCSWHNTLPGEMRWDRWGSSFDVVHPSIAALQYGIPIPHYVNTDNTNSMLYHTARISLNRPFVNPNPESNSINQSLKICDVSADIIVSILRRFKARYQGGGTPIVKDTNLPALDAALAELSHAWALAGQARKGLQDLLNKTHAQRQEVQPTPSPSLASDIEPAFTNETTQGAIYTAQCLKVPDNFQMATSTLAFQTNFNMMPYDAFDGTDSTLWDPLSVMDDGTGSWSSGR
jgi:hypothetical protein